MSVHPRQSAATLLCALILASAGCYSYTPLEDRPVDAGEEVRIRVSSDVDGSEPRVYTGRVARVAPDTLLLRVPLARTPGQATTNRELGRTVPIPVDRVSTIERQEYSVWKSAGLIAAGAAGSGLLLAELAGSTEQDELGGGDDDTGEFLIIPLFSIP